MSHFNPTIAIIGRPNVGKSTLFNRLIGRRQALVDETAGVTRDRIYGASDWAGQSFRVIDTGGIDCAANSLSEAIRAQTLRGVEEADILIALFDARDGLTPLDQEIVQIARRSGRPTFFAINKIDTERKLDRLDDFAELGSALYPISAEHGRRLDELLDAVVEVMRSDEVTKHEVRSTKPEDSLRIAIIGRPNVGKSSLVNRLAGSSRVVAHELPGTTRDAIDVRIESGDAVYTLIDTAGIRRRAKTEERVEKFSVIKALQTMERADVVLLVVDATEGATHQDRQLASRIAQEYRPLLLLINKWDLRGKKGADAWLEEIRWSLRELNRIPIMTISAKTGLRCKEIFPAVKRLATARKHRIKTGELNRLLQEVQLQHHLPSYRSQPLRLYYATQVGTAPPSFTIFANYPAAIPDSYRRYLLKAFEEAIGAPGLPIRLIFRKR